MSPGQPLRVAKVDESGETGLDEQWEVSRCGDSNFLFPV